MNSLGKCLAVFFLVGSWAWAQRAPESADFYHHPQSGQPYELWSYQFSMDNGTQIWLTYSWINIPAIGPKVAGELSVHGFKGKNFCVGKQYATSDWKEDKQTATITMHPEYTMKGLPGAGHHVHFYTTKNEHYLLDLSFTDALPTLVPPSDTVQGVAVHSVVQIPRGHVHGILIIGKDTLPIEGQGNLVHMWYPKSVTDLSPRSLSLFCVNGNGFSGRIMQGMGNHPPFGNVIHFVNGKSSVLIPRAFKVNGLSVRVDWTDSKVAPLELNFSQPYQKYSVLSTVDSWLERQAAKVALGGDRILLRGQTNTQDGLVEWVAAGFGK